MEFSIFISKADENLKAAELCHSNGLYNACANRAYYAMFQAAVGILITKGFVFEQKKHFDHAQVRSLFVNQLIHRKKSFQSKFKSYLYDVEIVRGQADYKPILIGQKKAERQVKKAKEFIDTIHREFAK